MPEIAWPGEVPVTYSVYRLVSRGEVIYVGRTNDLRGRIKEHAKRYQFDTVSWEEYPSFDQAEDRERQLIGELNPVHNIKGRTDRSWRDGVIESGAWRNLSQLVTREQ